MGFSANDPNINRSGRKKTNVYSMLLREQITNFCEENLLYFLAEIKNMRSGHAKAQAFLNLLNYCLPKLTENNSSPNLTNLSTEQIDSILKKYLKDD